MAHSRRQSLSMIGLIASLTVLSLVVVTGAQARSIDVRVGQSRDHAARFYAEQNAISREAAERWVRSQERGEDLRVIDRVGLPEGAILDFYTVRNANDPKEAVEFQGQGVLVDAYSYLGRHYKDILFGLLNTKQRDDAVALLKQARDHGFMVLPAAAGGIGGVDAAATQTVKVAVIATEFPHWNDPRPVSNGDTIRSDPGGTDMYYRYVYGASLAGVRVYPMGSSNNGASYIAPGEDPDAYADSPGGVLSANGAPVGLADNGAWSETMPEATSCARHPRAGGPEWKPELTLENDWYNLVFNKALPNSLTNYYYQNSHGHISIEGDHSDVVGWLDDHHVLDRFPYPSGCYYAVQPGTPLLRPTDRVSGPPIVRASLHANGITLFFRRDVGSVAVNNINVYQPDTSSASDNQPGNVNLTLGAGTYAVAMDPWDARRWTIRDLDFEYVDTNPTPGANRDFALSSGGAWSVTVTVDVGAGAQAYTWNSGSTGYAGQGRGCGALTGTQFTSQDVLGNAALNRLLDFGYYTHNHANHTGTVSNSSAYQLVSLQQPGGYRDDIAGSEQGTRAHRPAPFDYDYYDRQTQANAGGIFGSPTPGHTAAAMRSTINQVLADRGITLAGYNRTVYLFPDATQSEGNPNASIIPHATGNVITIPEGAGLTLVAHELGHTFGMDDLYDKNFYDNNAVPPPVPFYFECPAAGPYSVMGHGVRIDPWHKLQGLSWGPWAQGVDVVSDLGFTQIWQVEQTLRDPQIFKLPAHPLAIYAYKNPTAPAGYPGTQGNWDALRNPANWSEYFLLENRNVVGGSYFGDQSRRGLYVWHVDQRNIGGQQRAEETMSVIIEQADGLNELEINGARSPGAGFSASPGNLEGDPFPGSQENRNFTYTSVALPNGAASPKSWSHGIPDAGGTTIMPQTPTDSFVRVTDISDPGNPMSAKIYVEPAEIVVTGTDLVPAPTPPDPYYRVKQGETDFEVLLVNLNNDGTYPNLSTKDCVVNTVKVFEMGTSLRDANIAFGKLYEDVNSNQVVDPGTDKLLSTCVPGAVQADAMVFQNLGYTVPLGQSRNVIVAFDISVDAQAQPPSTVGAELTTFDFINLDPPGVVQQRIRNAGTTAANAGYVFGTYRFPIDSDTALIVEDPDTVSVSTTDLAPATVQQGATNVPLMSATFTVDHDSATVEGIEVTQTNNARDGQDILTAKAYLDEDGDDVLDTDGSGDIDSAKLLGEALFQSGVAHITGTATQPMQLTVPDGPGVHVIFTVDVHSAARVTPDTFITYQLANGCLTLDYPAGAPVGERDVADYASFPLNSGNSQIVAANSAPYAPPTAAPYDVAWLPVHGAKVAAAALPPTTVNCAFARARGTTAVPATNAPDPDATDTGSTLRYEAQFCQAVSFASGVQTVTIAPQGPAPDGPDVFTFTSPALANGTWFWRVRGIDDEGLLGAFSATRSFTIANAPTPPTNSPTPFYPAGGVYVPNLLPTYQWTRGTDTETAGSQLRTIIEVDDNSDFSSPYFTATSAAGAQSLANPAGTPLISGTHYYWRAKTLDGDGMESGWCPTQDFFPFANAAPYAPTDSFSPTNDIEVASVNPTLMWGMGDDPNPQDLGTPRDVNLRYVVELRANNGNWGDLTPPLFTTETAAGVRTTPVGVTLLDNGHYFWRVQTKDPAGLLSPWSTTQSFWVNTVNNAPAAPAGGFSPSGGATISSQLPTLQCAQAVDPDPSDQPQWSAWPATAMGYEFQLRPNNGTWANDTDYQFRYFADGDQNPNVVWTTVANMLKNATVWYWRVRAIDDEGAVSPWSATQNFVVDISNQAPVLSTLAAAPSGLTPKYGLLGDNYTFYVVYTDAEGDAATEGVWLEIDGDASQRYQMAYLKGAVTTGATYTLVLPGNHAALGLGNHTFRFLYLATASQWPATGFGTGPIIGTPSTTVITDSSWTPLPDAPAVGSSFEEGQRVYFEVTDADENESPSVLDTLRVIVTTANSPVDRETVTLTETDTDTGVFHGSIATRGSDYSQASGNGRLEAAGGPTGNTVTVTYADADCGPDCPAGNVDTSADNAPIYDTVPPAEITQIFPSSPPANEGKSIALDWTTYDEAGQVDVDEYWVYVRNAPFTDVRLLTPLVKLQRGTRTYNVTGLVPGATYYFAVVAQDEVPNRVFMVTGQAKTTADSLPPALVQQDPADGASEVARNTNISFHLTDGGSGVDVSTINATYSIDGDTPVAMNGTKTPNVDGPDIAFTFNPATDFPWNSTITVHVTASDVAGNMVDETYEFTVTSDTEAPTVTSQSPVPDSISARNGFVSFHVEDAQAGIDVASLAIRKDAVDITAQCAVDATDPRDVIVRYPATGTTDFGAVSTVVMSVGAADNAGNRTVPDPVTWEFDVDAVRPAIGNLVPGRGATNVPIDTQIAFRLTDGKSGLDVGTLAVSMQIGTGPMTPIAAGDLTVTNAAGTLDVSYQPPTPFAYDTAVTMQVVIADNVGNLIANADGTPGMYTWTFTTGPTPAFRIAGEVKTGAGVAIPGVLVRVFNALGNQVAGPVTDGNGTFVAYNMVAGEYRLVPELTEYDFAPTEISATVANADVIGQNFTGTQRTYSVSGRVTESGVGKAGVTVADSTGTYSAVTDADGNYTLTGVPSGRYTLTPTLQYYKFLPSSTTVVVAGAAVTGQDFQAVADTFSISGSVVDFNGSKVQGVRVTDGEHTAITNEAGQYTISGVRAGTVTLTATKAGYVFSPASQTVTVPPAGTGKDFTAYLSFANSFPVGINLVAVPCFPADDDAEALFGTPLVARWDPTAVPPGYVTPASASGLDILSVVPGRGFFVKLAQGDLEVAGRPVSATQPFTLTLGPVWNMVGNPFTKTLPFGNLIPGNPGSVRSYGWVYDAGLGSYLLVAAEAGVNVARTAVYPWEGMWLRTSGGSATVSVTPPVQTADAPAKPQALDLGADGWTIPVVATAGDRCDRSTTVGVAPALADSVQLDNPPTAPDTVDVYVKSADGKYLAQDIKGGSAATEKAWTIVVTTSLADANVEVSLPDLSKVPNDLAVYLTDTETGRRMYARTMASYSFRSEGAGGSRELLLEVAPRAEGGLVLTNAVAAAGGRGAVVTYGVSRDCSVSVTVTNIAGRVVREVAVNRASTKGANSVSWDLRSSAGTPVPNGRYLVRIDAMAEDGQRIQAVTSLAVRR